MVTAARTRTQLRQLVARQFPAGNFISSTSDASGNDTNTLADTGVLDKYADNKLIGLHLYMPDETPTDYLVTDSVQSGGTIDYRPDSAGTPNTETYELLPFSATDIHNAIDIALMESYDKGWLSRHFWLHHWLTGSPIYNSTFDYWTSTTALSGWTVDAGSISRLDELAGNHIVPGSSAAQLAASSTISLDAVYRRFLHIGSAPSITIKAWLRSSSASLIRARLYANGSVVGSTAYHSGDGTWELVESSSISIGDDVNELYVTVETAAGDTGDVGAVWLEGLIGVEEYPFPIDLAPDGPTEVRMGLVAQDESNTNASWAEFRTKSVSMPSVMSYHDEAADARIGVLRFKGRLGVNQRLIMGCEGPLTLPTTDAGVVEVSHIDSIIVAKLAAALLIEADIGDAPEPVQIDGFRRAAQLRQQAQELVNSKGRHDKGATSLGPAAW